MRKLTAIAAAITMLVAMTPIHLVAAEPALTGVIKGVVIETNGGQVGGSLRVQLVDSRGSAVIGKVATVASDGAFVLTDVQPGLYTVRVVGAKGASAVNVLPGRVVAATVSVSTAPRQAGGAGMSTTTKWVIALAAIGGAAVVGVVATKGNASGSQ